MSMRALIAVAVLVSLIVLGPSYPLAEEERPRVRCGKQHMTLIATGGKTFVNAGPLTVRKSDVRAIYVAYGDALTMWIEIGKAFLRPTIDPVDLRAILECLD